MKRENSIELIYEKYIQNPLVCTDTREIKKGAIFFALKGATYNGNLFAEKAIAEGCAYAVIDDEKYYGGKNYIVVENVLQTLQQLANYHRKQLNIPVIAITGSNGKTTSKELIAQVLKKNYNTHYTQGNLNNHIGVPLTLLSMNKQHQLAVIEMGANHQAEIELLCKIAEPNYGIITNIGKAHLEGFGGYEGVIKAKNEMYIHIRDNYGVLFVNADDELLMKLSSELEDNILYGTSKNADYIGQMVEVNPYVTLRWKKATSYEKMEEQPLIETKLIGNYNFSNILLAISIGAYFRVSDEDIKSAIEQYEPSNNRSQIIKKKTNTLFLDAYNANPTSMQASIQNFSDLAIKNKVLILGDMLELGDESIKEHQLIVDQISKQNFEKVFLIGNWFSKVENNCNAILFENTNGMIDWLKANKLDKSVVLLKGSRGMGLEKSVDYL